MSTMSEADVELPDPDSSSANNDSATPTPKVKVNTASFLAGKEGVTKIEVARVEWYMNAPWQRSSQARSTGTGFVIDQRRILTNAHVVKSAVDIRVRKHGSTRRFAARVAVYAPDVDLALIEIAGKEDERDFFQSGSNGNNHERNGESDRRCSLALELAEELPALQTSVAVVGYPTGGTTICITEGVVSRIDMVTASAFNNTLAIQIDAAINPGNSGGPAFNKEGKVTGVAFFKNVGKKTDNIGYLIPACVIRAFLGRCHRQDHDGSYTYTLSPSVPYDWHPLENHSLRLANQVPDDVHGVLVTTVSNTMNDALQKGDVLTHIDGKAVADDGQVVLRGEDELIQHRYLIRGKCVNEPTTFSVYRQGKHAECPRQILRNIPNIVLRWTDVDYPADYLILGALVLLPLSWACRCSKKCGPRLVATCMDWCSRWPQEWEGKTNLVVLVDIFAHEATFSYQRPWRRVKSYNGVPVQSLEHLRDLWQASCAEIEAHSDMDIDDTSTPTTNSQPTFARIELESDDDIVLEVKAAMAAQREVLERHQIPKASHISPPHPKYEA